MSEIVIDASVMVSILFEDEESEYSKSVLECIMQGRGVIVPEIFHAEVLNVILVSERRGRIDSDDIYQMLKFLSDLEVVTMSFTNKKEILRLVRNYNLTSYDATYLGLAINKKIHIATLDKRLMEASIAEKIYWEDK
jgi:predicted nucleic acid-binding protein